MLANAASIILLDFFLFFKVSTGGVSAPPPPFILPSLLSLFCMKGEVRAEWLLNIAAGSAIAEREESRRGWDRRRDGIGLSKLMRVNSVVEMFFSC